MNPTPNYYKVTCHRGHQGKGRSIPITFYIIANNAVEASRKARNMSGVKHRRPVMACVPITAEEYMEGRKESAYYRRGI